ncbi:hypothetical protein BDU57DRAFT_508165 [Ampelomyces quisqualis]|uniref:RRM domain-containing protein n=1 Tax=Ampelomyces quisqualis TaxID=50730 RepID=A0A6A5QWG4_AMPQU|nr:hypothetical protein BDU57DRAFT_508165 [Ampelomyces quisqualis]
MLQADVAQKSPQAQDDDSKNAHEKLEALHERLTHTKTFTPDPSLIAKQIKTAQSSNDGFSDGLEKAIAPYVIALQLEKAGLPWEQLRSWTTYLFSSGPDGHEACQEKDKIVQLATYELDAIIKQNLGDESRDLEAEHLARLPCRVVVSNIAAGADEDDLKEFFYPFRYQVQKLNMLPYQDPIKRTKVAHIDMYTRESAIRASYMTGSIFGLLPDIQLAVEKED